MEGKATKRKLMMLRRRAVAELFEEGITNQHDIAGYLETRFGITNDDGQPFNQATISRDLKALDKQWRSQATEKVDTIKARLLAKYERIYYEAFAAWQRSLEDKETQTQESIESGKGGDDKEKIEGGNQRTKVQIKTEGQSGNPALLAQAQGALKAIREMTGMDKEPGSDEETPFIIKVLKGISPDDL